MLMLMSFALLPKEKEHFRAKKHILTSVNTVIKQKIKYACLYNKHAQNYTKYA